MHRVSKNCAFLFLSELRQIFAPVGHSDHTAIDFRLDVRLVRDPDKNNDNAKKNIGNEEDRFYLLAQG